MQQVGVQAVCQRYGRSANSGLFAGRHDIALEFIAVAAAPATSHGYLNLLSVHVSTCLLVDTMLLKNVALG
ncbi:MAG: hypothetical protein RLZZ573_533 [Pseudomonadota bacterium]